MLENLCCMIENALKDRFAKINLIKTGSTMHIPFLKLDSSNIVLVLISYFGQE